MNELEFQRWETKKRSGSGQSAAKRKPHRPAPEALEKNAAASADNAFEMRRLEALERQQSREST